MTTRFWLIRHGETEEWARQRCYGSLEVGLSPNGRIQMARAAQHLKTESIASIFSSPRTRALDSARMIAAECSCPCEVVPGLREIDFGDFEGLSYDEIAARYPEEYQSWMEKPVAVRFPNGEDFSTLQARVLGAFRGIAERSAGQTVGIVTHGGVIRVLVAWALQIPGEYLFRIGQDFGAMNLLVLVDDVSTVQLLNWKPTRE